MLEPNALKAEGLEYFWLYDLRSTFASRLTEAGVSPLFVAHLRLTPFLTRIALKRARNSWPDIVARNVSGDCLHALSVVAKFAGSIDRHVYFRRVLD